MVRLTAIGFLLGIVLLGANNTTADVQVSGPTWVNTLGGTAYEEVRAIAIGTGGEIVTAGSAADGSSITLSKYSSGGELIWSKRWDIPGPHDGLTGCALASNGDIVISGYIETRFVDGYVMRIDTDGNFLWGRHWGSGAWDPGDGVTVDQAGDIVMHLSSNSSGSIDNTVVKYDASGNLLWQTAWHLNSNNGTLSSPVTDNAGNIYNIGLTGAVPFPGGQDVMLVKFDASGALVWDAVWSGTGTETAQGIAYSQDGNVYVTGWTDSFGAGDRDVLVLKFDATTGELIWQKTWGGTDLEESTGIVVGPDGLITVAGISESFDTNWKDLLVLVYDEDGNLVSSHTWGNVGVFEGGACAAGDAFGFVAVGGWGVGCTGDWLQVSGLDAIPSGTLTYNQGTIVTPVGDAQSFIPTELAPLSVECGNPGSYDQLLLGFATCGLVDLEVCSIDAEDVNCDGVVNVFDVVAAVDVAFRSGAPSVPCCRFE